MPYVINIEDGASQEYFYEGGGRLVHLADEGSAVPQVFKTISELKKKLEVIRPNYPPVCDIYFLHVIDFEARRKIVKEQWEKRGNEIRMMD